MIQKDRPESELESEAFSSSTVRESSEARCPNQNDWPRIQAAPITLFAIPKPFTGDANHIQRNAISSWTQLRPAVEVVLLGEDDGTAEFAAELDVAHIPGVNTNSRGTPLLGSAFSLARQYSASPILIYCNCDVILMKDFVYAIKQLMEASELDQFLAIHVRLIAGSGSAVGHLLAKLYKTSQRSGRKKPRCNVV